MSEPSDDDYKERAYRVIEQALGILAQVPQPERDRLLLELVQKLVAAGRRL